MDKKQKFLNKIPVEDRRRILKAIDQILAGNLSLLDIVKLKGYDNRFRVRVGNYRIKFTRYSTFNEVTEISYRDDNTYSRL